MDKRDKSKRGIAPIVCLLLSIGLWFYVTNVENPIRNYELTKVPVELINIKVLEDHNLVLSPDQQFYVNLKLEGYGSDIYRVKKSDFIVQIDLSDYALKKGENKIPVDIEKSPTGINIKNDNTLNVVVMLEDLIEKTVSITSELTVNTREGFFATAPEIEPKEINILGAESIVNKVDSVVVYGEENDLTTNIVDKEYPLKALDIDGVEVNEVEFSQEVVKVNIKISKGKSVPIKVNTVGELPNGMKLNSLELSRNSVELLGPQELLDNVSEVYTSSLDLASVTESSDLILALIVPNGLEIVKGEESVSVRVNLTKVITKEFDIPFSIIGKHEGITVTPNKNTVKVTISGYEESISSITADQIKAELNVTNFNENGVFQEMPTVTLVGLDNSYSITSVEKIQITVVKDIIEEPSEPAQGEAQSPS